MRKRAARALRAMADRLDPDGDVDPLEAAFLSLAARERANARRPVGPITCGGGGPSATTGTSIGAGSSEAVFAGGGGSWRGGGGGAGGYEGSVGVGGVYSVDPGGMHGAVVGCSRCGGRLYAGDSHRDGCPPPTHG